MRHSNKNRKLGREQKGRNALIKSLVYSLVLKEKIKTTDAKARTLRPVIEKMVTLGKKGDVATRRLLTSRIGADASTKLMKDISPRFKERAGGYTRITKLPRRLSDGSLMSVIEFV
jgi:large subunit ribosomal protein L17